MLPIQSLNRDMVIYLLKMVIVLTSIECNTFRSGDVQIKSYTLECMCERRRVLVFSIESVIKEKDKGGRRIRTYVILGFYTFVEGKLQLFILKQFK